MSFAIILATISLLSVMNCVSDFIPIIDAPSQRTS